MQQRPLYITITAWLLIILVVTPQIWGIYIIKNSDFYNSIRENPAMVPFQFGISYVSLTVGIVTGLAILNAHNWSRFLYVIFITISFVFSIIPTPLTLSTIICFIFLLFSSFMLFLPAANRYFTPSELYSISEQRQTTSWKFNTSSIRTAFSILINIFAGFIFFIASVYSYINSPSLATKWGMILLVTIIATITLCCGLALNRFHNWKRNAGIVFLGTSLFNVILVVTLAFLFMSENFPKIIEYAVVSKLYDYPSGSAFFITFAGSGWLLFKALPDFP